MNQQPKAIIHDQSELPSRIAWLEQMVVRGLPAGPVVVTLGRNERKRSSQANRLLWKLLTDISRQVDYMGQKWEAESWKDLISALHHKQEIIPGLDGGLVALGRRTSRMKKAEFSELIEVVYSVGSERNVQWSTDTAAEYANYKEAQK